MRMKNRYQEMKMARYKQRENKCEECGNIFYSDLAPISAAIQNKPLCCSKKCLDEAISKRGKE